MSCARRWRGESAAASVGDESGSGPASGSRRARFPRPAVAPRPPMRVDYSQADARVQRRSGYGELVHYLEFDVVAEVRDRCGPLASEIVGSLSTGRRSRIGGRLRILARF